MSKIRVTTILAGMIGLALLAWLLADEGIGGIFTVLSLVGLNIVWIFVYRIIPIWFDAYGWSRLFAEGQRPCFFDLTRARWLAESVNTLFPVGQVGGHILRARVTGRGGRGSNEAGATVMVDFTTGLLTQTVFTIMGLALLLQQIGQHKAASGIVIGIVIALVVISFFFFSQKAGLFGFMARVAHLLVGRKKTAALLGDARYLDQKITEIYSRTNKLLACFFWRLVGWTAKSGENWLFFFFAGAPITLQDAVILESISTAFRSAAFFVPGGLGVQDGSLLFTGSLLGLGPDMVMALALAKRFRELAVGIPGLLWWFRIGEKNIPKTETR
jgi:putative membrane protein